MRGTLYGVGVGPGDPELLTLKSVRLLRECDLVGIPARSKERCTAYKIALQAVPELAQKEVISIPIPMTTEREILEAAYEQGANMLMDALERGMQIVFLNLGDPTIYSTYMTLHERVKKAGYAAELVSGVPSFCAVAAELGIAIASGDEKIQILPGFYYPEEAGGFEGTGIIMKSAGKITEVKEQLLRLEAERGIKAYAVTNCGMEDQKVWHEIQDLEEDAGYFTTLIIREERGSC